MLRKRSRSKQALMADPSQKQSKPTSFPRLFTAFTSFKSFTTEYDAVASPTSTLDPKPFSVPKNRKTHVPETRLGLAIVDSLVDEEKPEPGFSRTGSRMILFGSQLRIQVPDSPRFPADFGIKTRNSSHLGPFTGSGQDSPRILTGHHLSASEMELSEDYTCVTSHGPNPRTIHIFENFIVENQSDVVFFRSPDPTTANESGYCSPDHFLSTCCTCKKNLGPREDIFMYRGERAFCSSECRSEEIMLEEKHIIK